MGLLTPVEQQTKEAFGMVPMEERLSILPRYNAKQGLIAPQFIYDLAKAVSAPITAARGYQVTPEESVNTAVNAFGGGGIGTAPKGALRTFIGRNAKTWDAAAEAKFLELEKKGIAPEQAWQQTNTFRSPDGKLRQEISDLTVNARYAPDQMEILDAYSKLTYGKPYGTLPFGEKGLGEQRININNLAKKELELFKTTGKIIPHKQLYEAYPELSNILANVGKGDYLEGSYNRSIMTEGSKNPITKILSEEINAYAPNETVLKSGLLHELQHAIQQREGFARGGSPTEFANKQDINDAQIINSLISKGNKPSEAIKWVQENLGRKPSTKAIDLGMKSDVNLSTMLPANEQYKRLAGEAEARAVQARMNMTPAQRAQTFPLKSYDVPINELILKGLLQ